MDNLKKKIKAKEQKHNQARQQPAKKQKGSCGVFILALTGILVFIFISKAIFSIDKGINKQQPVVELSYDELMDSNHPMFMERVDNMLNFENVVEIKPEREYSITNTHEKEFRLGFVSYTASITSDIIDRIFIMPPLSDDEITEGKLIEIAYEFIPEDKLSEYYDLELTYGLRASQDPDEHPMEYVIAYSANEKGAKLYDADHNNLVRFLYITFSTSYDNPTELSGLIHITRDLPRRSYGYERFKWDPFQMGFDRYEDPRW